MAELQANPVPAQKEKPAAGYTTQWKCQSVTKSHIMLIARMLMKFMLILLKHTALTQELDLLRTCEGVLGVLPGLCVCLKRTASAVPTPHRVKATSAR